MACSDLKDLFQLNFVSYFVACKVRYAFDFTLKLNKPFGAFIRGFCARRTLVSCLLAHTPVPSLPQAALPHLRKTKGNIINMSSWTGAYGQSQAPTYCATKGAITVRREGGWGCGQLGTAHAIRRHGSFVIDILRGGLQLFRSLRP